MCGEIEKEKLAKADETSFSGSSRKWIAIVYMKKICVKKITWTAGLEQIGKLVESFHTEKVKFEERNEDERKGLQKSQEFNVYLENGVFNWGAVAKVPDGESVRSCACNNK